MRVFPTDTAGLSGDSLARRRPVADRAVAGLKAVGEDGLARPLAPRTGRGGAPGPIARPTTVDAARRGA